MLLAALLCTSGSFAYSVLTHEEIVDLVWTNELRPLLLLRFPGLTEEQLTEAHSYAYGGAVIQDPGYYPFGSVEFSNLVHYVRSGDFVEELLRQSQDADEYAFALGALAHYASDIAGHPAVNQAVSLQYPKLRAKYGADELEEIFVSSFVLGDQDEPAELVIYTMLFVAVLAAFKLMQGQAAVTTVTTGAAVTAVTGQPLKTVETGATVGQKIL